MVTRNDRVDRAYEVVPQNMCQIVDSQRDEKISDDNVKKEKKI